MMDRRDLLKGALAGAGGVSLGSAPALAQEEWPSRPLHVFIGFAPGSGADILCRYYTAKLQEVSGRTVVPENRPGAVGSIAINLVHKAKPDGYSILFTGNTLMAGGRHMLKDFTIDYRRDFTPVCGLFETPFVMVVGGRSPAKNVSELIALLKSKPQNKYGFTNPAAMVAGFAFKSHAGVNAEQVSYRTTVEAVGDLESGMLDYQVMDGTFAAGQARAGKLRIIASTTEKRISVLPDVPTMAEAGVPDFLFSPWWGVWLPLGSPPAAVAKLAQWITQINKMPETAKFLGDIVALPTLGDANYLVTHLDADRNRWDKLAAAAGMTPQ
ncbi:MAG: Tripartite-type tricarboxylate transporter, receptor component TctC [Hyphomicrobiales bacterium]|nr:Tripartite-type tricarboxylate transporter, receptor component TctC [Hyphomicrobiales bacterium]